MKRNFCITSAALLCIFLSASVVLGQSRDDGNRNDNGNQKDVIKKIVITGASVDSTMTRLTITGVNFLGPNGKQLPTVLLRLSVLPLVSETSTQIIAVLPGGLTPGAYLLTVSNGSELNYDTFDLAIGGAVATGPSVVQVFDSKNVVAGQYLSNGTFIREISGLPVEIWLVEGWVEFGPTMPIAAVFYASPDCTGPAIYPLSNIAFRNGFAFNGNIYFNGGPMFQATANSSRDLLGNGTFDACSTLSQPGTWAAMQSMSYASLGLTPPFSIK